MPVTEQEVAKARRHLMAWVQRHMEDNGIETRVELAANLGVSKGSITLWFKEGGPTPSLASLMALAKETGMPIDIMLTRDPKPRSNSAT